MNWLMIDEWILNALQEDIPDEDITTNAIVDQESRSEVQLLAKEEGILAGSEVFERVFSIIGGVEIEFFKKDSDRLVPGDCVAILTGKTRSLLTGERVALNILQRMCGIATHTNQLVQELSGTRTKLLDTRKTTPNMRILEKYAVKIGGGENHRFNLSDGVLIKDNHIQAAGSISKAISAIREYVSFVRKIEVEVENLDMVREALESKADIIMLDNMSIEDMKEAVDMIKGKAITEASGNITIDRIASIAQTGVDFISCGAITHSNKGMDLSMKKLKPLNN